MIQFIDIRLKFSYFLTQLTLLPSQSLYNSVLREFQFGISQDRAGGNDEKAVITKLPRQLRLRDEVDGKMLFTSNLRQVSL